MENKIKVQKIIARKISNLPNQYYCIDGNYYCIDDNYDYDCNSDLKAGILQGVGKYKPSRINYISVDDIEETENEFAHEEWLLDSSMDYYRKKARELKKNTEVYKETFETISLIYRNHSFTINYKENDDEFTPFCYLYLEVAPSPSGWYQHSIFQLVVYDKYDEIIWTMQEFKLPTITIDDGIYVFRFPIGFTVLEDGVRAKICCTRDAAWGI